MARPLLSVLFSFLKPLRTLLDCATSSFWGEKCFPQILQGSYKAVECCQNKLASKIEGEVNQRKGQIFTV